MSLTYPNRKAGPVPAYARIQTDSDAQAMISEGIGSHGEWHDLISLQQEHLDGKPPYDPEQLVEDNLGWMHNRNYGKATAKSEKVVSEKTFTVIGGYSFGYPVFAVFEKDKHAKKAPWLKDENQKDFYANAIRIAYATTLEKEMRAYDMVSRVCYYAANWGVGFVTRDNDDWLGYGKRLTDVFFTRATEFDNVDAFFVFDEKNVSYFYKVWEQVQNKRNTPWNKEALKDLFIWALGPSYFENYIKSNKRYAKVSDPSLLRHIKWEYILNTWQDASFMLSRDTTLIRFAKIWNDEVQGGVTETYSFYDGTEAGGASISSEILFQTHYSGRSCIKDEFIEYFRDNPITSNGVVQNMRGLARFAVPDSHQFNVKKNAIEDKIMVSGNMQFKQNARNQGEKFDIHVTSIASIMPTGFDLVEKAQDVRIQEHIQTLTLDEANYQRETQHYDPSLSGRLGDRATSSEVQRQSMEVSRLQNAKDAILREDWGRFHKNCLLRLANDSYRQGDTGYKGQQCFFREFCRMANVTMDEARDIAKYIEDFDMAPILGDIQQMKESIALTPDPYMKNELVRQLLYMMGHSRARIEFLRPRMNRFEIVSGEAQLADLQNNMLWDQQIPLYNPNNDPKTALDVHYQRFDEAIQSASQGADPVRVFNYLRAGLFFVQNHLKQMAEDPLYGEEALKPYLSKYQGYQKILGQLESLSQRAAAQAQGPAQPDAETQQRMQLELIEFQGKEERKEVNQQLEARRREEKHQTNMRQQAETHNLQMALQLDNARNSD